MAGRIYLLDNSSQLVPMDEAHYDSERLLQESLAKYPDLLAGEQINSEQPRRWLLVTREMRVPGEDGGGGRWSLDHLFLDQDAVPTLVEIKRSSDTRIRREVIGQMLDYAANAVVYWPVEDIKAKFEARCQLEHQDIEDLYLAHLGHDHDIDQFWRQVKTNLQAGRIRMVFVADVISPELRRIVEFLNGQMDPAEVLAVEVRQFVGKEMKTLVPRVFGQTELAKGKKIGTSARRAITKAEFLSLFDAGRPAAEQQTARQLIDWGQNNGLTDHFRSGQRIISYEPELRTPQFTFCPILPQTRGLVVVQLDRLRNHPPFDEDRLCSELFRRLQAVPDFVVTEAAMSGRPRVPISSLVQPAAMQTFPDVLR